MEFNCQVNCKVFNNNCNVNCKVLEWQLFNLYTSNMEVKIGKYKHFKGLMVEVIGIALHSETLEEMVVYKKLEDFGEYKAGSLWVRPKAMFLEEVERDGKKLPRFTFLED